jgi:hypothetical protein
VNSIQNESNGHGRYKGCRLLKRGLNINSHIYAFRVSRLPYTETS